MCAGFSNNINVYRKDSLLFCLPASARDVNKEKFEVTLVDVDDLTPKTQPADVVVSCPPENR